MAEKQDFLKDVQLNHELIDWSDPKVDANFVTKTLMGTCAYWKNEEFDGMKPLEIERKILFEATPKKWGLDSPYGKPYFRHFLTLMRLIDPSTDITPTIADATMMFCLGFTHGKKMLNLIGCQNCLAPDTEVRMFDGSLKRASSVSKGDKLLGADGTPRTVKSTCSGQSTMYKITPRHGEAFVCTGNHKLTLIASYSKEKGRIVDVPVEEYLMWPVYRQKQYSLFSAQIDRPDADLGFDPYVYGVWLGDGSTKQPRICAHPNETALIEYLTNWWQGHHDGYNINLTTREPVNIVEMSFSTPPTNRNPFTDFIRSSENGRKFIRPEFIRDASRRQRLELLAGLIDTDGHSENTFYRITSSNPQLMDGIEELVWSLGFRSHRRTRKTNYIYKDGTPAYTEILSIYGAIGEIPLKLTRKLASNKGVKMSGASKFTVECVGVGDYAGFEVDGDHRFLLKDYTITHNSSKSASSVRIAFTCLYIDPEYTVFYVANPFDNAADSTIWGEVIDVWESICEHHPHPNPDIPNELFPNSYVYASKRVEVIKGVAKAARIELRNTKHVGKFKGTKSKKDSNNQVRGVLGMLIDEVNEIDNMAFLQTLTNITSQDNFFAITSQNFTHTENMGGILAQPNDKPYGGAATYEDLHLERDIMWHSNVSSITLRFDGLKAANIIAGRNIYPYLFKQVNLDHLRDNYGDKSPEWMSQCRSFPINGEEANSVLSQAKITGSRHTDKVFSVESIKGRVSFCDPSFGGKDKAVWGWAEYGTCTVTDGEGRQSREELLIFREYMKSITLVNKATYDDHWFGRMRAVGLNPHEYTAGADVSFEDQIALRCLELNKEAGIPAANFGYDFSMRPDIVSSVNKMMGFQTQAFDYNQKPEGYYLQGVKQMTDECCYNRVDELAFLAADLFVSRQIRGGDFLNTAVVQLQRTRYEIKNAKYKVERKADYKARWQNVSPDHRDVLMGIVGMAHKRGFRANNISKQGNKSLISNQEMWKLRSKFKSRSMRRI